MLGCAGEDDRAKHLGGTYPADCSESVFKQVIADHPRYKGLTLTYD